MDFLYVVDTPSQPGSYRSRSGSLRCMSTLDRVIQFVTEALADLGMTPTQADDAAALPTGTTHRLLEHREIDIESLMELLPAVSIRPITLPPFDSEGNVL